MQRVQPHRPSQAIHSLVEEGEEVEVEEEEVEAGMYENQIMVETVIYQLFTFVVSY